MNVLVIISLFVFSTFLFFTNNKINKLMAKIAELTEKVDALQVALDSEQEQIKMAIEALEQAVAALQTMVEEGGTTEQRQALADRLDSITNDLKSTVIEDTEGGDEEEVA